MSATKRFGAHLCIAMLAQALLLPQIAAARPLGSGSPAPVQASPSTSPQVAPVQIPIIDDSYIAYIDFISVTEQEIVSIWATTSGCDFTLRFTPDEPATVLGKSGPYCDFEAWTTQATIWIDSDRVASIWDHSEWLALFAYTSGIGNPDQDPGNPIPPPESWLEVEEMDDCGRAIARATLMSMLCAVGFGVAWGVTGSSAGVFGFTLVAAVATCGLAMMDVQDAIATCQNEKDDYLVQALDDLLYYNDVIVEGDFTGLFDMEAFVDSIVEVEELLNQPYSTVHVGEMVAIQGRMIETAATP